jgi:hypothetical protein
LHCYISETQLVKRAMFVRLADEFAPALIFAALYFALRKARYPPPPRQRLRMGISPYMIPLNTVVL